MTPTATYRLQLTPDLPFAAAEQAVPRLAALGVSHLHLSPVLEAVPGSAHGYDVTDHSRVREELGGEDGLRALSATARTHGLALVLDIVPNHMAVPADVRLNAPLWEVLRDGPGSRYARWFDIDWDAGSGRMLLPVLGAPLREELDGIEVEDAPGGADGPVLRCGAHVLPLREGTAGLPLRELLDAQHYRLAWWRLARTELNYRRFFTVSDLIGVRVEDPEVFDATHATVLRLLHDGVVDGLRVDHPDGLADPPGYLRRLHEATGGRWTVVEKILARGEHLPQDWPVAGTTGYDALAHIDGVLLDGAGLNDLGFFHRELAGPAEDRGGEWEPTARAAAHEVVEGQLVAEVERLARIAVDACAEAEELRLRDLAPWALREAIRQTLVRLPVYRPYVRAGEPAHPRDVALVEEAAEGARGAFAVPEEAEAVGVVADLALGRLGDGPARRDFAVRFGQVSSALRAKSEEDRAFYRYTPLLSVTEVGGSPGEPAVSVGDFHAWCARTAREWPATGTVVSTHDTKRSADVRAALAVLSECPRPWARAVTEAGAAADAAVSASAPDPHAAWAAWQSAFGLGEPDPERLGAALLKSVREAGLRTTWTEPDEEYEKALTQFVTTGVCESGWPVLAGLRADLAPFLRSNVLATALLHLTVPGVPDVYMGGERLSPTLVDPDNRRPAPEGDPVPGSLDAEKLALSTAVLRLRRDRPEWFAGSYEPLAADGPAEAHCVAYARGGAALTVVTRHALRLAEAGGWRGTTLRLPEGRWRDALGLSGRTVDGGPHELESLLVERPVALFVRE